MSRFSHLADWLHWQEQLHTKTIDLGLARVHRVALALGLVAPPSTISHQYSGNLVGKHTVITVAGTNGKGSCIAALEQCLLAQGKQVGSYTSPHLHHYCERIRIDGQPVSEAMVCSAFSAIDAARGDTSLTYFEFGTLAALWLFVQQEVPYVLLEVGLGGRLDAVNIIDADMAVITSIDLDHQAWLGDNRECISREKLGIARDSRPLVIAETDLTPSLKSAIAIYKAIAINTHFSFWLSDGQVSDGQISADSTWYWQYKGKTIALPLPLLPLPSVAAALVVLSHFELLPDNLAAVIAELSLPGRYEKRSIGGVPVIFDVAHNPAATSLLANRLQQQRPVGRTLAVVAMMADKDIASTLLPLLLGIDHWYLGVLHNNERAAPAEALEKALRNYTQTYTLYQSIDAAFHAALTEADHRDRIVVFGSFFTVAALQSVASSVQVNKPADINRPATQLR